MWFHDIFQTTGQPYDDKEVAFIKQIIAGENNAARQRLHRGGHG